MDNEKIENLLNLSLDASSYEREKSLSLNVGFDEEDGRWDLIVRYVGDKNVLGEKLKLLEAGFTGLLGGYAIINVEEQNIIKLAEIEEILYIEKPKRLEFAINQGISSSGFTRLKDESYGGKGVIVAVIDSGIDIDNEVFYNEDGTTKILGIWDQSKSDEQISAPSGYNMGAYYEGEEQIKSSEVFDISLHGTQVAGIVAKIVSQASLLIVKLASPKKGGFPRTSELMQAVDFCIKKAIEKNMPIVINLSFGNTYGAHNGESLFETYLNIASQAYKTSIVVGSGNEGAQAGHTSGMVENGGVIERELGVRGFESGLNVQIWKNYADRFLVELITPTGKRVDITQVENGTYRYNAGETELLIYYGVPIPYTKTQEIYIDFIPNNTYVTEGIWKIVLKGENIVYGRFDMWLPAAASLNGSSFLTPTGDITITIPATAQNVISVGAYNSRLNAYADFSGRGYVDIFGNAKPDIVAPGVNIESPIDKGSKTLSGTSFATPFVSAAAAILMEWGVVNGNDVFLYGEKLKAYLLRGAKRLPGYREYPNAQVGFGSLDMYTVFNNIRKI